MWNKSVRYLLINSLRWLQKSWVAAVLLTAVFATVVLVLATVSSEAVAAGPAAVGKFAIAGDYTEPGSHGPLPGNNGTGSNLRLRGGPSASGPMGHSPRSEGGSKAANLGNNQASSSLHIGNLASGGPIPPVTLPTPTTPVYLIVSAFRDGVRCARTLSYAIEKAKYPQRLEFRVMQAMDEALEDVSCAHYFKDVYLKEYCKKRADAHVCVKDVMARVKVWTIPLEDGMGPAHQRGLLNELLEFKSTDAFCMTTDSHMDFHHDWDELTIEDWMSTNNEFAVLTAYPMSMMDNQEEVNEGSHVDLCGYFLEDGIPRGKTGANLATDPGDKPYLTMNWAAGLSFHRCHADRNVPVDKNLRFIFTGEEVNRATRLWTNGYDLYLPSLTTVYHDYSSAKQEFWNFQGEAGGDAAYESRQRLATLLELEQVATMLPKEKLEPYGLGTQRTLEQWVEWSCVDMGTERWRKLLHDKGKKPSPASSPDGSHTFCQQLHRVPVRDVASLNASIAVGGPPRPSSTPAPWDL